MVPYVDAVVDVTVIRVLFVLHVCDGARLTAMLVLGMDEVWRVQGMCVVHVVQALCLAQVCLARGGMGEEDWVWVLPILWEQG